MMTTSSAWPRHSTSNQAFLGESTTPFSSQYQTAI